MPERGLDDDPIILIVDDDADLRKMMVLALHRAGFETRQAGSGDEALAMLQAQSVDGVVLDMGMPGASGTEVVHRPAERPGDRDAADPADHRLGRR